MDVLALIALAVMPVLVVVAGLHDLTTFRIPNWIPVSLAAAFVPAALLIGLSPVQTAVHLGVGLAALVVGMGLFALRWVGGGDAKLIAAASLWLGLGGLAPFLIWTAVFGGLLSLALLSARKYIPFAPGAPQWAARLLDPKGGAPYGVAIAAGALMAFPHAPLFILRATGG